MPTISEILAARAAAQIPPPGKSRPAAGMVLTKDMPAPPESRGQRTPVRGPEETERALGGTQGELIPMTPPGADAQTRAWHEARVALASEMCVMRDPQDPEACWLALRPQRGQLEPLLLHRLPWLLWDHPAATTPDLPF